MRRRVVRSEMLRVLPASPFGRAKELLRIAAASEKQQRAATRKKKGHCPSFFYIILLKKLIMQHADRSVGIVFINEH